MPFDLRGQYFTRTVRLKPFSTVQKRNPNNRGGTSAEFKSTIETKKFSFRQKRTKFARIRLAYATISGSIVQIFNRVTCILSLYFIFCNRNLFSANNDHIIVITFDRGWLMLSIELLKLKKKTRWPNWIENYFVVMKKKNTPLNISGHLSGMYLVYHAKFVWIRTIITVEKKIVSPKQRLPEHLQRHFSLEVRIGF